VSRAIAVPACRCSHPVVTCYVISAVTFASFKSDADVLFDVYILYKDCIFSQSSISALSKALEGAII